MVMKECDCGCGKKFEVVNARRKYYNRACQMRVIRRTDAGKAYVEEYNKRFKRPVVDIKCKFPLCGVEFSSSYKRKYCDEHSNPTNLCKVWRKKNPIKAKAYERVHSLYRQDRDYNRDRKREPCVVCGKEPTQAHHHDYKKPLDIIFLCMDCHNEIHKWDAISV